MIEKLVDRPVSTLIGALTLVVLGAFCLLRLPVSLLPAAERPSLRITATAEGSSREELLDRVTRPLERQLGALGGVTSVRTLTGDGAVQALVESEWQTDADRLRIEVERRLGNRAGPEVSFAVEMAPGDAVPIVEVAVLGGASGAERTAFAREGVVPELARLAGAGRVETVGLTPLRVVVQPRPAALAVRGLSARDVAVRLDAVGLARPAGQARAGALVRPLIVREDVRSLEELKALRIPGRSPGFGGESLLGDVATVGLEEVEDGSAFRLDGKPGVLVRVFRAPEANAVALAAKVRERLAALDSRAGLRLQVVTDRSTEVGAALRELGLAALAGLLLGTLVLRAFLGSWRPTLALAVVVPASALATFAVFQLRGVPLDLISLGGLALASGLLVDSSIVVLEAIASSRAAGTARPDIAGTRQIAVPVLAGFATTAVTFLPMLYLQGLARAFFGVQAFAIVASLAASLLFSLTVTPVLSRAGHARDHGQAAGRHPGRGLYLRWLDRALARPGLACLAALALCAGAAAAAAVLPRELLPHGPVEELVVRYRLDPTLTPEAAGRAGAALEERLAAALGDPQAGRVAVQWTEESRGFGGEEETGRVLFRFADPAAAARALPRIESALARVAGAEAWVEPGTRTFVEAVERAGRRLEVVATASTPERARDLAGRAAGRLRAAGLRDSAAARRGLPQPALLLSWDALRLAELGAGRDGRGHLESQVQAGLTDRLAGRVRLPGSHRVEPEVLLRATAPADPGLLPLATGAADSLRSIPLGAVATLSSSARPPVEEHQDGLPAVRLAFEGPAAKALPALAGLQLAADEEVTVAGQALEMQRAFGQLRLALALSLLLVFLTVAALYESFSTPLAVMATVPVALAGGLGLLAATGQSLNVLSFLGLILLVGIVVNNAIVLVHRTGQRAALGEPIDEALRRAAAERYRPILMTTVTTLAGMLPLALLGGDGAELRRPLALAVLGGLATSLFASLLLVPVLYRAFARARPRSGRNARATRKTAAGYEEAA